MLHRTLSANVRDDKSTSHIATKNCKNTVRCFKRTAICAIFRINEGAVVICHSSSDYWKMIKIVQELTDGVVIPTKIM